MISPESTHSKAGSGARSDRPSVPTGGSRADLCPVAIFISRPGEGTETRHLPAGSMISTHNASVQRPIEFNRNSDVNSKLPYIKSPCHGLRHQPVSLGSCVLRGPTVLTISTASDLGPDVKEDTWLPAGTMIEEAFTKCPDCLLSKVKSSTSDFSPSGFGNQPRVSQKVPTGTKSRRFKANMFQSSMVYTKSGDKLSCPSSGGVKETGAKIGEGYFDVNEQEGTVSISAWYSIDGEKPSQIENGVITTIPYGRDRSWIVSLKAPRRDCDGLQYTDYHCSTSLLTDHAIPNEEIQDFLDQRKSELEGIRRSKAQPPA
jgi:hypothetical protein